MNLNTFYRDDRVGEYEVRIDVRATIFEVVKADSAEAARAKVEAMLEAHEIDVYGSDFDHAEIIGTRKTPPIFCIDRPGTNVTGASHPQPGDTPRLPNQYEPNAYKPESA